MIFFVHTAFVLMLSLERQNRTGLSMSPDLLRPSGLPHLPLELFAVVIVLAASIPSFPTEAFHAPSLWTIWQTLCWLKTLWVSHPS